MAKSRRLERVNDQIRDELAQLFAHEIRDPRLQGLISITGVETSPDLTVARIFVSVFADEDEATTPQKHIQGAQSFLRREVAARLNLRNTPELDFRLDRSIAQGARIEQLLKE